MLKLLVSTALVLFTAFAALAQEMQLAGNGAVNMREGPGTNYRIVGRMLPGTTGVFQVRRTGQWIYLTNGGWVHADLLKQRYPVLPVPVPTTYVVPPVPTNPNIMLAISPSRRFAAIHEIRTEDRKSVVSIIDASSALLIRSLESFEHETLTRYQFLTDTLLIATKKENNSDYAKLTRRDGYTETLIDLASDTILYQGSERFHEILQPPGIGDDDYFVSDGFALIRMSAATHEALDRVWLRDILPDLRSDPSKGTAWIRRAGPDAAGRPTFVVNLPLGGGPIHFALHINSRGIPIGIPIPLGPGEFLFDVSPDGTRMATLTSSNEKRLASELSAIPFHAPWGKVDFYDRLTLSVKDMVAGFVSASRDESFSTLMTIPGRDRIYVSLSDDLSTIQDWSWSDLNAQKSTKFATDAYLSGLELSDRRPRGPDRTLERVWGVVNSSRFVIPSVLTRDALTAAFPDGLPDSSLREMEEPRNAFNLQVAKRPPGNWKTHLQIYGAFNSMLFDFESLSARPTSLERPPYRLNADRVESGKEPDQILSSLRQPGLEVALREIGPAAAILANRLHEDVGIVIPEAAAYIPLQGVSRAPRIGDKTGPRPEDVTGEFGQVGIFAYGEFDPETNRTQSVYTEFTTTGSVDRVVAVRNRRCSDEECQPPHQYFWHDRGDNYFLSELVVFDAASGEETGSRVLTRSCNRPSEGLPVPSSVDDDIIYVWTGCHGERQLKKVNLRDGSIGHAFAVLSSEADVLRRTVGSRYGSFGFSLFDDDRIIGFHDEGKTISFYWREAGTKLATLFFYPDSGWLLMTSDGFYTMGREGDRHIKVVQGLNASSIDRFRTALYRPDLVYETFAGDPEHVVARARRDLSLTAVMSSGAAPDPRMDVVLNGATAEIELDIREQGGGIGTVEIRVNGVVRHRETGTTRKRVDISVAAGVNRIEVVARNRTDMIEARSEPVSVTVNTEDVAAPKLFVLAVGIDDYKLDPLKLNFAASDARRVARAFEETGQSLYSEIETIVMTDADVTRDGLAATFVELSQRIRPNDVFIFFVAGHGKTIDGRYNFVPVDFDGSTIGDLRERGIGQTQISEWFAMIPAQKSLMLFDTCDSGSLVETSVGIGLSNAGSSEMLGNSTGRAILSASSSRGVALEGFEGSGLFTHVLIEALSTADHNADGMVDVFELAAEVEIKLPVLAQQVFSMDQQSAFRQPSFSFDVIRSER